MCKQFCHEVRRGAGGGVASQKNVYAKLSQTSIKCYILAYSFARLMVSWILFMSFWSWVLEALKFFVFVFVLNYEKIYFYIASEKFLTWPIKE